MLKAGVKLINKNAQLPVILAIMVKRSDFLKEGSQRSIGGLKCLCVGLHILGNIQRCKLSMGIYGTYRKYM